MPGVKIVNKYSFGLSLCPLVTGLLKPLPLPQCPAQSLAHRRHSGSVCGMNREGTFCKWGSETRDVKWLKSLAVQCWLRWFLADIIHSHTCIFHKLSIPVVIRRQKKSSGPALWILFCCRIWSSRSLLQGSRHQYVCLRGASLMILVDLWVMVAETVLEEGAGEGGQPPLPLCASVASSLALVPLLISTLLSPTSPPSTAFFGGGWNLNFR